jgi:hypothetical protein
MNPNAMKYGMMAAMAGLAGCGDVTAGTTASSKASSVNVKETVVTNADGSVTKTKKEVREIKDANGNVIGHETSVFSETTMGESKEPVKKALENKSEEPKTEAEKDFDSFLGLKFGETPAGAEKAEAVPGDNSLLMFKFTPEKKLAGFDDYYAFVTPKTRKLVKVCACAKNPVESNPSGRRHYLVEALENKYGTRARLSSWLRPLYILDVGPGKGVSLCLTDASDDYETVIAAWDDEAARLGVCELREMRDEAFRKSVEERQKAVKAASDVF